MYDSELEAVARGEFDLSDPLERGLASMVDPVSEPTDRDLLASAIEILGRVALVELVEHEIEYLREVVEKIDAGEV